jgi:hypothetical protein
MSGNSTVEGGIMQHHIFHAMTFSPSDRHEREALVDRGGIIEQIGAVEVQVVIQCDGKLGVAGRAQ